MMESHVIALVLFAAGIGRTSHGFRLEFVPGNSQSIVVDECVNVTLHQSENSRRTVQVGIESTSPLVAEVTPTSLRAPSSTWSRPVEICGLDGGRTTIIAAVRDNETFIVGAYLSVLVSKGRTLETLGDVSGWVYILAWSVASYPQVYLNYSRGSVVGLSFDFIALSYVGCILYLFYNCGMYFSTEIKYDYFRSHVGGLNPVKLNDVVFSFYEAVGSHYLIYQCYRYEHSDQRVSRMTKCVISSIVGIVILLVVLACLSVLQWLDVLLWCSYTKLLIITIKYIPQAISNYRRKSTIGWSVAFVILTLLGGVLCIVQMVAYGYNYNDWESILGNLAKFGIAFVKVAFSLFFMYQHYVLYRNPYHDIPTDVPPKSVDSG